MERHSSRATGRVSPQSLAPGFGKKKRGVSCFSVAPIGRVTVSNFNIFQNTGTDQGAVDGSECRLAGAYLIEKEVFEVGRMRYEEVRNQE